MPEHKTIIVIQARLGSTRLPGKPLIFLDNKTLIEWVIHRCQKARLVDGVVLAIPSTDENALLYEVGQRLGCTVVVGDEEDVLSRFVLAADGTDASHIVRVCADNPFVDPGHIDELVEFFGRGTYDYACNHIPLPDLPRVDGFGAEIFSKKALKRVAVLALVPRHKEHVTSYFWECQDEFRIKCLKASAIFQRPDLKLDIDTSQDLQKIKKWISNGVKIENSASEIIKIIDLDS